MLSTSNPAISGNRFSDNFSLIHCKKLLDCLKDSLQIMEHTEQHSWYQLTSNKVCWLQLQDFDSLCIVLIDSQINRKSYEGLT